MSDTQKVTLTINGKKQNVTTSPDMVLIDVLRNDLHLTGTKQSCDRKGQCGACTVIVNGKAVRSCIAKVAELNGADVITVEGLGTPENPHLIQEAFVLAGAIQCGFCTPGMIMATKALLDQNPNPKTADIKKALTRNLCRCTGYTKIISAVNLAASFVRGDTTPAKFRKGLKKDMIGVSHPRPTAMLKACGLAKFGGDIFPDGAIEIACVHATEHYAKIKSIDTSAAVKMPGVIGIMTAKEVPGTNVLRMMAPDQPILAGDTVRLYGEPVAIVGAETREQARAAAAKVKVEYDVLKPMMTPEEALAPGAPQLWKHSPNLIMQMPLIKGDAQKALGSAAKTVEANFSTQMNHQAPLEPETCVAYKEGDELVVYGRSIQIHGHKMQLQEALGCKVRYVEPFVGGQFGIKATISSEGITGAAALYFKRPVRYIPSLQESMWITSKRHPFDMKLKLAADANGKITALQIDMVVNKGAYMLLGPVIPSRALGMLSGSYFIPNISSLNKLVYTTNGAGGAARGAGPPQANFALESAMDMMAEKYGIDPLEYRKLNSLKPGQSKATGMMVDQWPFPELCDLLKPYYEKAKKAAADFNKSQKGPIKHGVGLGAHSFGIADPANTANVTVEVNKDDSVTIYGSVADPGEGNDSMLTQIAAHVLEIPMDKINLYVRSTDKTPNTGVAAGSRMTFMGGGALLNALYYLSMAMKEAGSKTYDGLKKAGKATRYEGFRFSGGSPFGDPKTGQGESFRTDVHNIQMAEIEVNTETGEAKVLKMTTVVDAGTIINPNNFEGQLEGGMDQGVGYALREEYVSGKTKDWVTFKFPTINNTYDIEIYSRETPRIGAPLGATGIGEMTMVSTAPAVTNAIYNACGARVYDLPANPERVKAALAKVK